MPPWGGRRSLHGSANSTRSGASIRYTLDGSAPSATAGTVYAAPFAVSANTTVNAIAYVAGFTASQVTTATYGIQVSAPAFAPPGDSYPSPQTMVLRSASATRRFGIRSMARRRTGPDAGSNVRNGFGNTPTLTDFRCNRMFRAVCREPQLDFYRFSSL